MRSLRGLIIFALIAALAQSSSGFDFKALLGAPKDVGDFRETTDKITKTEQQHLKGLVWRAVRHLNADSETPFFWTLDRVVSARKQLVAGLNYAFDVLVARSDCLKQNTGLNFDHQSCDVPDDAPREYCTLDVYVDAEDATEQHFVRNCRPYDDSQSAEDTADSYGGDRKMMKIMEKTRLIATQQPADIPVWSLFSTFVGRYEKSYSSKSEALRRFNVYKRNMNRAKMMQDHELGTAVYGETQFMDMTPEEFERIYLPYKWEQPSYDIHQLDSDSPDLDIVDPLPASVDWRKQGIVTDVKNQESCGSCWAFSVTGNIEGQWALKKQKLIPLSEQELLDCDVVDQACNGGLPLNAYKEIIRLGGLEPESIYPYDARKENCHLERSEFAAYINDSIQLPQDEAKMAVWLFKNGPISIGVNAYPLQFYRHGISHPWKIFCSPQMLNHGVLIVGYGTEGEKPFWIIKNSWGPSWGESGYYRLYRGKNVCGVNEMATSAIIN